MTRPTRENVAFTERAIAKAQRLSIGLTEVAAITQYLMRQGRMAYSFARKLWLVEHPIQGWQVAVWMMPACEPIEVSQ